MTYKNIVDSLEEIINAHHFIQTYGYGNLSDIAVPDNEEPPKYPYAFVNPVDVSNGRNSFSWQFNLILMTQVNDGEDSEISGQDECMQIIQDIVSVYTNTNDDPLLDMQTPFTMTPFKERFQDDVVGATATLTINYAKAIDGCDTPFSAGIISERPEATCPQVLVVDGDESEHWVDAGDSYSCLPATAKSGIFYQRIIPWENNDPSIDGSVYWHTQNNTYDYTPPTNPLYIALLQNGYRGSDADCLLMQQNAFGNYYRFTNDVGQQFVEQFHRDAANTSDNPRYCIDHLTGLGWYVERATTDLFNRNITDAIDYVNTFSYNSLRSWRLADVSEYLNSVMYHDYQNSYQSVYAPFVDNDIRNYGGTLWTGTYTKDNQFIRIITNSATLGVAGSTTTVQHLLMVRNHYI